MYKFIIIAVVNLMPLQVMAAESPTALEFLDKYAANQNKLASVIAKVALSETYIDRTKRPSAVEILTSYERALVVMREKVRFTAELEQTLNGAFTFKAKKYKHRRVIHRDGTRFGVSRESKRFDDQNKLIGHDCLTSIHEIEKAMITQNPYGQPPEHLRIDFRPKSFVDRFLADLGTGDKLIDGITSGAHNKTFFEVMSEAYSLQLRDSMEIMDGHKTYVLEAETKYGKHILWIDPEYGFNARRMAIHKVTGDYDFDTKLGDQPRPLPPNVNPAVPWCATVKSDLTVDDINIEKVNGRYVPISAKIRRYEEFENGQFTELICNYKRKDIDFNPDFDAMVRNFIDAVPDETKVYVYHEQRSTAEYKWYKGEVVDFQGRKVDYRPKKPQSLLGKPLPSLEDFGVRLSEVRDSNSVIVICFFDIDQRPSRHCVMELANKAEQLKEIGIMIVAVQTSKVDEGKLNKWIQQYAIGLPVGMVEGDINETRLAWGVRSLPWLILADNQHIVTAEGFALNELEDRLKDLSIGDSTRLLIPDDMKRLRETLPAVFKGLVGYHIEYRVDKHPLDEQYFPQGNIENALKPEDPDSPVLTSWIKGMRQSYSHDIALDVFDSCYLCRELKYALDDKQRLNLKHEGISSTDGDKNYAYWPQEKQGTIATDNAGRVVPENPLTIYKKVTAILAEQDRFKLVSAVPAFEEGQADAPTREQWLAEFCDAKVTEGYRSHQLLINSSPMLVMRDREFSGSSQDERFLQTETLFEDFATYKLDDANIVLPRRIVKNSMLIRGTGLDNEPTIFAEKTVVYLKDLSAPKLTKRNSFAYCFPAGTEVWVKDQDYTYVALGDGKIVPLHPPSILDMHLPELKELRIELSTAATEDRMILVCFFDVNQRPSRYCIGQLVKKAPELEERAVTVVTVQASEVSEEALDEFKKQYNIPFPVSVITRNVEKARFAWGVRSLPWLILMDKQHIVTAEGFSLKELDDKIKGAVKSKQ